MPDDQPSSKDEFLHPRSRYYGQFTPSNFLFNANLQEFATKIGYICGLETNGKISSTEAYSQIKQLMKTLKQSKKSLGIGKENPSSGKEQDPPE
jgi:hypothetical protein